MSLPTNLGSPIDNWGTTSPQGSAKGLSLKESGLNGEEDERNKSNSSASIISNLSSLAFLAFDGANPVPRSTSTKDFSSMRPGRQATVDDVEEDLREPFLSSFASKQLLEKQQDSMVLIIDKELETQYKQLSLRALLQYVNERVELSVSTKTTPSTSAANSFAPHLPLAPRVASPIGKGVPGAVPNAASTDAGGKRSSLSAVDAVQLRDLRRLDYSYSAHEEPFIFVRKHAVIFSMTPLRAIVMADMIIFFLPDGADEIIQVLMEQLRTLSAQALSMDESNGTVRGSMMSDPGDITPEPNKPFAITPFEAIAYEALLASALAVHTHNFSKCKTASGKILHYLEEHVLLPLDVQEKMRLLKNDLSSHMQVFSRCKQVLELVLDDIPDMAMMNLSYLRRKPRMYETPLSEDLLRKHEHSEILLELHMMDYCSMETKSEQLRNQLTNAEDSVLLRLDTSRNQLLVADTVLSICTLGFGIGSFIGSIFGMNLHNKVEDGPWQFQAVTWGTIGGIGLFVLGAIYVCKRRGIIPSSYHAKSLWHNSSLGMK